MSRGHRVCRRTRTQAADRAQPGGDQLAEDRGVTVDQRFLLKRNPQIRRVHPEAFRRKIPAVGPRVRYMFTLEQIVALKFIGLPLNKIKSLLRKRSVDLSTVLRAQRTLLEQKKDLLERAITAIGLAQTTLRTCGETDSGVFRHVIEVIEMQNKRDVWKQKYDELMQGKIERLRPISPDARTQLREQFADLFKEVEGVLGEDPQVHAPRSWPAGSWSFFSR